MDRNRALDPSGRVRSMVRGGVLAAGKAHAPQRALGGLCVASAAFTIALSGCGGSSEDISSKSGPEILAASKKAVVGASSVHVVSKTAQGPLTASMNLQLTRSGGRAQVSIVGRFFEAIRIGDELYVKGSPAFYKTAVGTSVNVPRGTWLKAPADSGTLGQLAAFTQLSPQLNRLISTPGPVTKGSSTTVNGQKAIELKEATKVYKGVLYVATTGKPYPIALVKNGGKAKNEREKGRTVFSEWDEDVSLNAPSPSVDVSTLARSTVEP